MSKTAEKIYVKHVRNFIESEGDEFDFDDSKIEEARKLKEFNLVINAMEEYADQFKPKWISVEERMPDNGEWVIAAQDEYVICCHVSHIGFTAPIPSGGITQFTGITHWMPLPEPPK